MYTDDSAPDAPVAANAVTETISRNITFSPISDALGAVVDGVDLAALNDDTFEVIRQGWHQHLVLLFRDQTLSDDDLAQFSCRFGDLDLAPPQENGRRSADGHPEVMVISNVVENGVAIGNLGAGESKWHTDMNYMTEPPTGSVLYGLKVPESGGDTGFLNMYAALETLPDDLRAEIQGKEIKHDASTTSAGQLRAGAAEVTNVMSSPGAVHPIIRTHPETGRQALYLGRRGNAYVVGLSVEASETLLDRLWEHVTQDVFTWHHRWQPGDVLVWDNRCTMHRRDGFDPKSRRVLHRTQIKGTRPV